MARAHARGRFSHAGAWLPRTSACKRSLSARAAAPHQQADQRERQPVGARHDSCSDSPRAWGAQVASHRATAARAEGDNALTTTSALPARCPSGGGAGPHRLRKHAGEGRIHRIQGRPACRELAPLAPLAGPRERGILGCCWLPSGSQSPPTSPAAWLLALRGFPLSIAVRDGRPSGHGHPRCQQGGQVCGGGARRPRGQHDRVRS